MPFKSRKGIMRIIEVIIASIILLAATSYFLSPKIRVADWQATFMKAGIYDAIAAMDRSGMLDRHVKNNMAESMYGNLSLALPLQTDFAIKVSLPSGDSYDMCCSYSPECCKDTSKIRSYIEVPYVSKDYTVSLLVWNIYY